MSDKGDVAFWRCLLQNVRHRRCHSRLGINCPLPAAYVVFWVGEERARYALELGWRKIACGAAVVLVQARMDVNRKAEAGGQKPRRLDGLDLIAGPHCCRALNVR
jgi:hypothetical protein